ncbi:MAG: Mrp/NBP35 family ATP-binding protein [Eubacterium sp.]
MVEEENCTHDCGSCGSDCDEREEHATDFTVKPHPWSNVKKVIGVVSGKGGVGKSLVTSTLAVLLRRQGLSIGILDADITGPSIPKAFGITGKAQGSEKGIYPIKSESGIDIMSMNLLLENDTDPVVWRGPVIAGAVKQFWSDVIWEYDDYLFVDMPPGTGDVPLTVFQSLPINGIIIVTSPQELVSMIVEKAVNMANMMNIPIIGVIENMSYVTCPDCNKKINIFGESHIEEVASKNNLKVLAKLPIDPETASLVDKGEIEKFKGDWLDNAAKAVLEQ